MKIPSQKLRVFGAFALIAFAVSACSSEHQGAAQAPPPLVRVITLENKDVELSGDFVGQTSGSLSVQVRAQVGGILKKRNYKEGDFVKQGQILFEIDPDTYRAALEQAKGKLAQAAAAMDKSKREWDRIQPLYSKNAVSQRDRDQAETSYNGAKADFDAAKAVVDEAQIKLSYAYVTAPIAGYTSKESWTEGNLISLAGEGGLLTEINQLDPIFVDFSIPSTEYQRIRQLIGLGKAEEDHPMPATLRFAEGGAYAHAGEVTFIDTKVDVTTSVVRARAVFPNPERVVLPGQFVRVTSKGIRLKNALLIPQTAMIQTQQGAIVMVLDEKGLPQSRPVKLGQSVNNDFVVEDGLKAGERVIAAGVNKIRPGQPVRIDDSAAAARNAAAPSGAASPDGKK